MFAFQGTGNSLDPAIKDLAVYVHVLSLTSEGQSQEQWNKAARLRADEGERCVKVNKGKSRRIDVRPTPALVHTGVNRKWPGV